MQYEVNKNRRLYAYIQNNSKPKYDEFDIFLGSNVLNMQPSLKELGLEPCFTHMCLDLMCS